MSTQTAKEQLIAEVQQVESNQIIALMRRYLQELRSYEKPEAAWLDDIPPMPPRSTAELKADLQQALLDTQEGRVYSSEQVLAMARKW